MVYNWLGFLTDYGLDDGFVAACHGVVGSIAPALRIVDITHLVPPGDVTRGGVVLAQTVPYLPPAVHVAVVDPGVGSARRAVAVAAGGSILIGPDNGLLPPAADALGGVLSAHVLTNEALWRHPVSATFHGRDIFCPVAAHLANGVPIDEVGPAVDTESLLRLPPPVVRRDEQRIESPVVTVDRFGNVQLAGNPPARWRLGESLVVESGGAQHRATYVETFAAVPPGGLVIFVDSAGLLALAVNRGSAAERLGVAAGATVTVRTP